MSLQGEVKISKINTLIYVTLIADFGYSAQLTAEENKRRSVVGTTYW